MINRNEEGTFKQLLQFINQHPNDLYTLYCGSTKTEANYVTDYESDNGLELDDDGYEEYQCIVFKSAENGTLFEINYHTMPDKITSGETIVI